MLFDVRTESRTGWVQVTVMGELDLSTAPEFRRDLRAAIATADGATVVVDLGGVSFVDSVGLGLLVGASRRARTAGGTLVVMGTHGRIDALLAETGLSGVLDVRSSFEPTSTTG